MRDKKVFTLQTLPADSEPPRLRAKVVPGRQAGKAEQAQRSGGLGEQERTELKRHRSMTWSQRLKRVFAIEIETCRRCGGRLRVIASIEEPAVIQRILDHLSGGEERGSLDPAHSSRGPPQGELPI